MAPTPVSRSNAGEKARSGRRARGTLPRAPAETWWTRLWKPFWTLPAMCVLAALIVGIVLPHLEESWGGTELQYVFQGGPDGAREVLGTIATAMISFTGLVFSITIVVLQLASNQFTPRALGGFLQNRIVQSTLGVFIATFVFALTVTRYVRGANETEQFVPQISVTVAFVMVLACMALFLAFIHHITTSIQVSYLIARIGTQTLQLAARLYPEHADAEFPAFAPTWSPAPGTAHVHLEARQHGTITHLDYVGLVQWARRHDAVIVVDPPIGGFLAEGEHLLSVWGLADVNDQEVSDIQRYVQTGLQRDMRQDVGFGIRQLVDIADRALSAGVNDPTTAVQCLNELHRILRHLVQRASPSPYIADDDGNVRVVHHPLEVTTLLKLALQEIAHFGKDTLQIPKQLRLVLNDLLQVSADRYRDAVRELLDTVPDDTGTQQDNST